MHCLRSRLGITNKIHGFCPCGIEKAAVRWQSQSKGTLSTLDNLPDGIKPFEDIPEPKGLPYFGTYFKYKLGTIKSSTLADTHRSWHKEHGSIVKETLLGKTVIHVFDPDAICVVYANEGKWPRIEPLAETTRLFRQKFGFSPGLGNSNDEEWYNLRKAVQKLMMRPKEVLSFLPAVDEVTLDFVSHLKRLRIDNKEVPNFSTELGRWSLESSALNCFSRRLGYLTEEGRKEAEEILSANQTTFEMTTHLSSSLPLYEYTGILTPKWKRLFTAEKFLYKTVLKHLHPALDRMKEKMDRGQMDERDFIFLRYLISKKELTMSDVAILTQSLFFDPLSTTVAQLQFMLYLLAVNPRAQDRLYKEIRDVAPPFPHPLTASVIGSMSYLRACVKESFRMLPVGTEISRITKKDMVLGGYHIPANTSLHLDNYTMYRQPCHFTDPDTFLPERWLRNESAEKIHPFILLPFGFGARMCVGRRFAEQDMAVVLTRLLQNFRLEWHHAPMGLKYLTLHTPDCPAQYTFCDR